MHAMSGLPRDDEHSLAASGGDEGGQRITSPPLLIRPDSEQHSELASLQERYHQQHQQEFPPSEGGVPDIPDMVAAAQHRRPA